MSNNQKGSLEFETWWNETYQDKLGNITLELAFKEIALAAWNQAIKNLGRGTND